MDRDVETNCYVQLGSVLASLIGKLVSKDIQFLPKYFFFFLPLCCCLGSLPGYTVALCLTIAIKNKASNDEIFSILKDVPNPNQDDDDGKVIFC